jgi:flagellar basal body-associated protein FliL
MARPTKPKDLKPVPDAAAAGEEAKGDKAHKGGGGGGGGLDLKFIVTILTIVMCSIGGSVGAMYFLAPMIIVPAIVAQLPKPEEHGAGADAHGAKASTSKVGMNLELDEFTVNLKKDPNIPGNQFVRTKMALSITAPEEGDCTLLMGKTAFKPISVKKGYVAMTLPEVLEGGVIVGAAAPVSSMGRDYLASGGGAPAASPYDTCMGHFKDHMGPFVPTIRDIVNAALMKRTAGNLASPEGQEALKDEIKDQINHLLDHGYQVVRVNFQDFIIQR